MLKNTKKKQYKVYKNWRKIRMYSSIILVQRLLTFDREKVFSQRGHKYTCNITLNVLNNQNRN